MNPDHADDEAPHDRSSKREISKTVVKEVVETEVSLKKSDSQAALPITSQRSKSSLDNIPQGQTREKRSLSKSPSVQTLQSREPQSVKHKHQSVDNPIKEETADPYDQEI